MNRWVLLFRNGREFAIAFVGWALLPVAVLTGKSARPTTLIGWPFLSFGILCSMALGGTQAPVAESETAYRVGLARKCITPDEPLWMAGYMGRRHPSRGVLDDLYAQALAIEVPEIRFAVLCPGFINTDMTAKLSDETKDYFLSKTTTKRAAEPWEIGQAAVLAAADYGNTYKRCSIIMVAGGMELGG